MAIKQQLKCKTKQNKKPTTKSAISIYLKSLPCPVVLLTTHTMQYAVCALEICVSTNTILPKKYFFFSHSLQKKNYQNRNHIFLYAIVVSNKK